MQLEYKTAEFETKDIDEKQGIISGHAAAYGNVDDGGDIIEAGAGAKTIAERAKRVKAVYGRDFGKLVGHPTELREDSHGLYTVTKIAMLSFWGKEVHGLASNGSLNEMSIGYATIPGAVKIDPDTGVRRIGEYKLYEYSFVPLALNPAALVDGVKSATEGLTIKEVAEWLDGFVKRAIDGGNLADVKRAHDTLTAYVQAIGPDATKSGTPPTTIAVTLDERAATMRRLTRTRPTVRAYVLGGS